MYDAMTITKRSTLTATQMGVDMSAWGDTKALDPCYGEEDDVVGARGNASVMVWVLENLIKLLDARRQSLITREAVAAAAGSLLASKRQKKKRGLDPEEPYLASKKQRTAYDTQKYHPPVNYSDNVKNLVLGKFKSSLLVAPTALYTGNEERRLTYFVKALLACEGVSHQPQNKQGEEYERRPLQIPGASDMWVWFNMVFGEDGRKRLQKLSLESKPDTMALSVAARKLAFNMASTVTVQGPYPTEVKLLGDKWTACIRGEEASARNCTVAHEFRELNALAEFGTAVKSLRLAIKNSQPQDPLNNFEATLKAAFPPKKGNGMTTLLLLWLCQQSGMDSKAGMVKMKDMILRAEVLVDLMAEFGKGILLFVRTPYYWRFKRVSPATRKQVFKTFASYWQIKHLCTTVWDEIGKEVMHNCSPKVVVDLTKPGYTFLPADIYQDGQD